jgi:hypothetical protein
MSDLQEIIATSSIRAYNAGAADERRRIVAELVEYIKVNEMPEIEQGLRYAADFINLKPTKEPVNG